MYNLSKNNILIILILLLSVSDTSASEIESIKDFSKSYGNKIHVVSHYKEFVVTDPSKGYNRFSNWVQFPSDTISYRKIILNITYQCPDTLHCGQWDYLDGIFLRRVGSQDSDSLNYELARTISPYGWSFDSTWSFSWHVDVTDFGFALHDSVEIEFYHGGYENNEDRGWLITLDFEITEGRSVMECIGIDTLWSGKFTYGDSTKPIEELLHPIEFSHETADIARLRIHQSGHGMDDSANCAEFCSKYRQVYFDDSLYNQRQIWRKCTDNPLYPQAGTWIFDRANWCPGSVVFPDIYDFEITKGETHTVNIDMEPYINPNKPSANYWIYAYLFYYKKPWATNDVSIEEIIIPSNKDVYSRINPACVNPEIIVKNNGIKKTSNLVISYGMKNDKKSFYKWKGGILPQQTTNIIIPTSIISNNEVDTFVVNLNIPDEYPFDNYAESEYINPPILPSQLIIAYKANKEPTHNASMLTRFNKHPILPNDISTDYQTNIKPEDIARRYASLAGTVAHEIPLGSLVADSIYRDTLILEPGCYQFNVVDTSGDGLALWFNPDGGYGYLRLLDMNGQLIKDFNPDFGSEIKYSFRVLDNDKDIIIDNKPIVRIFPPRNEGLFEVDLFFNKPTEYSLKIISDSLGTVYQQESQIVKELYFPIDISSQPDGTYHLNIITPDTTITRRVRIKH